MNQDQLKEKLLTLAEVPDFTLVFSGKKSKKVDGLYKPATREIIIHNKNMEGDTDLMYTAIHEFTHHVVSSMSGGVVLSNRCHTAQFWAVFHQLLEKAEKTGLYDNPFRTDSEFLELTSKIKNEFLIPNGSLMRELAEILNNARNLCLKNHLSFDDYVDRELGIPKTTANTLLRIEKYDVDPSIGYDNMKTVASVKDDAKRESVQKAFQEGESVDTVKNNIIHERTEIKISPVDKLEAEKTKLEKAIENLQKKLQMVDKMLKDEKNKLTEESN